MTNIPSSPSPARADDEASRALLAGGTSSDEHGSKRVRPLAEQRAEFERLFAEFTGWLAERERQAGAACWSVLRADARRKFAAIADSERLGLDLGDAPLLALLPHEDTPSQRRRGAFCHVLPGITQDLRSWFQDAGWTRPEHWAALSRGVFLFVRQCDENPVDLWQACDAFAALPGSRGFDSGLLSPILNALRPEEFLLVNAATRATVNHFTGASFGPALTEYPEARNATRRVIDSLRDVLLAQSPPGMRLQDAFSVFCHWLMNERLPTGADAPAETASAAAEVEATPDALPEIAAATPELALSAPVTSADAPPAEGAPAEALPAAETPAAAMPAVETPATATFPAEAEEPSEAASELAAAAVAVLAATLARAGGVVHRTPPPEARVEDAHPAHLLHDAPGAPDDIEAPSRRGASADEPSAPAMAPAPLHPAARAASERVEHLCDIALRRGQLLLHGPAGSGKNALAARVAERLMQHQDGLLERLAFHPGWSYADFIQHADAHGNRRAGRLTAFCRAAAGRKGRCVLLIHDLQRADADAIFGEALALLDQRGIEVTLAGGGSLCIPPNVVLLATWDTESGDTLHGGAFLHRFAGA